MPTNYGERLLSVVRKKWGGISPSTLEESILTTVLSAKNDTVETLASDTLNVRVGRGRPKAFLPQLGWGFRGFETISGTSSVCVGGTRRNAGVGKWRAKVTIHKGHMQWISSCKKNDQKREDI